jgi:hypothetical protein
MKLGQTVASSADVTRDYHDPRSSGRARQVCDRGGVSMTIRRACCARHCLTARCTLRSCLSVNRSGCIDLMRARIAIAGKPGSSDNQAPICSRRSSSIEVRWAISTCSSRNCAPTTAPRNLRPRHFNVTARPAHQGRNPQIGETIQIAASKAIRRWLPGRRLHLQRNPRRGSKPPLDVREGRTAASPWPRVIARVSSRAKSAPALSSLRFKAPGRLHPRQRSSAIRRSIRPYFPLCGCLT